MAVAFIQDRNAAVDFSGRQYVEVACKSTDTKPVGNFMTGSMLTEVNTGKVYLYDSDGAAGYEWVEQFSLQG